MMDLYLVWVRDVHRWIDSIWIKEESAYERAEALKRSAKSCTGTDLYIWVQIGVLQDGCLEEPEQELLLSEGEEKKNE